MDARERRRRGDPRRAARRTYPSPVPLQRLSGSTCRQVAETFGTRLFLILINAVNTILIARILGPEGRGEYAVAIAVSAIGAQLLARASSANTYFVAGDRSLLGGLTSNSIALGGVVTLLGVPRSASFRCVPAHPHRPG